VFATVPSTVPYSTAASTSPSLCAVKSTFKCPAVTQTAAIETPATWFRSHGISRLNRVRDPWRCIRSGLVQRNSSNSSKLSRIALGTVVSAAAAILLDRPCLHRRLCCRRSVLWRWCTEPIVVGCIHERLLFRPFLHPDQCLP
jgi:hypothetical protein